MNVTERTRILRIESILEDGKVVRMQAAYITEYVTDMNQLAIASSHKR